MLGRYEKRVFRPITALYYPPHIQPLNFAKRQSEQQWVTPPIFTLDPEPENTDCSTV